MVTAIEGPEPSGRAVRVGGAQNGGGKAVSVANISAQPDAVCTEKIERSTEKPVLMSDPLP